MKKFIAMIAVITLVLFSLSACELEPYEDDYDEGYSDGWEAGFDEGYYEGIAKAQHSIAFYVEDDLFYLERDIERKYGIHPEEAVQILSNFADVPDEVTEEEVYAAIWSIYLYYHASQEVINGIEDYSID